MLRLVAVLAALAFVVAACGPQDEEEADELGSSGNTTVVEADTASDESNGSDADAGAATDEADGSDGADSGSTDDDGADGAGAGADDGAGAVDDAPVVTLLDPGAEPRSTLRIQLTEGDMGVLVLTQSQSLVQRINGEELPNPGEIATSATSDVSVGSVEGGRFEITSITSGSEVVQAPSPGAAAQAEAAMAELIGIGTRSVIDDRGRVLEVETLGVDGLDPVAAQLIDTTSSSQVAAPLPEEAIGVGARWEIIQQIPAAGLELEQVLVYELISIEGSVLELAVDGTQQVPVGSIMDAQGIPAEVVSWDLTITGTATQDLTSPIPESSIEVAGTQAFVADGLEIEQDLVTRSVFEAG